VDAVLTEHGKPVQVQGANIRHYSEYLLERAKSFGEIRFDFVRGGQGRLKKLSVDKGLLRQTESAQIQIEALLQCDVGNPGGSLIRPCLRDLLTEPTLSSS